MKTRCVACLVCLVFLCAGGASAQSVPVVRMTTDQHVTLTLNGAPTGVALQWSVVDPSVPLTPGQGPFRAAYIVAFAPSADGQACVVTPKGRTPISDGLGTWEVQVRAGPLMVGRATLIIVTEGATGITPAPGSAVVASSLMK